jgi:hypothetical protein
MFSKQFFSTQVIAGGGGSWLSGLGGARSDAGPLVTVESALTLTSLQACVTLIAESIAQLPLELFRRDKDGGREPAKDYPLYRILAYAPNEWQTPFEYRENSQLRAGTRGNSISLIGRDGDGTVTGLYAVDTEGVQVLKGPDLLPYYRINSPGADPAAHGAPRPVVEPEQLRRHVADHAARERHRPCPGDPAVRQQVIPKRNRSVGCDRSPARVVADQGPEHHRSNHRPLAADVWRQHQRQARGHVTGRDDLQALVDNQRRRGVDPGPPYPLVRPHILKMPALK